MFTNNQSQNSQLEKIIQLALGEATPDGSVKTTTVSLHMSQMREWGVRGGNIQIKAIQDFNGIRKDFIFRLLSDNYLKQRLEPCMDRMVARGEILWLVEPDDSIDSHYRIEYYVGGRYNPSPEYEVFYQQENKREIECVVICEEFETNFPNLYQDTPNRFLTSAMGLTGKKYQVTFIDKDSYIRWELEQKPQSLRSLYFWYAALRKKDGFEYGGYTMKQPTETPNPFAPEFPFVICKNYAPQINKPGIDDFYQIKDSIEDHNELLLDATKNLKMFYTPTLVTSRDAGSVVEDVSRIAESRSKSTWAGQNGFRSILNPSQPHVRMPQIVGNVKDGERFGYVQSPDAVSGDQNLFIRNLRELIHWTLGGVDPLGISASATFGEIKSLFGRIENTAMRKADILLGDKGLCKLLSRILLAEERKCKVAMTNFIVEQYLNGDKSAAVLINREITDTLFRDIYFYLTKQIKLELPGLPPLGQRDCVWRYTKDVFQRTTREMLDASIVYRNEREDGISQEVALGKLYPNMRDDEIRNSMSGFSPRVVQGGLEGIGAALQLYTQFMRMPAPDNPNVPWALALGLDKIVSQGIQTLKKEMSYDQPEFKESVDLDEINAEINNALSQLKNVRTTNPPNTLRGSDARPSARG